MHYIRRRHHRISRNSSAILGARLLTNLSSALGLCATRDSSFHARKATWTCLIHCFSFPNVEFLGQETKM